MRGLHAIIGLVLAGGLARAGTAPAGAAERLTVQVAAHVTAHCALSALGPTTATFGGILDARSGAANGASLDLPIAIDCNSPYRATLTSSRGALATDAPAAAGFTGRVAYRAELSLSAGAGGLSLACASPAMTAAAGSGGGSPCAAATTADTVSAGDGHVRLTLAQGGPPLLRGDYSDTLTLSVTPNLGGAGVP